MAETFSVQIGQFIEKANGNVEQVVKKVCNDVLKAVVDRTPVGNPTLWKSKPPPGYVGGRARFNWNVGVGYIDGVTTHNVDPSGERSKERGRILINGWRDELPVYITNSLPYIRPLEYGRPPDYKAHSQQAPNGMVRITVAEWHSFVERAVAEVAT